MEVGFQRHLRGVPYFISYIGITGVGDDSNDIYLTLAPVLLGDINGDGAVNGLDVDPFARA